MPRRKVNSPFSPKRILLCNTGRLGDVFIMTRMLPRLEGIEVGVLVSKAGRAAAQGCPGISQVHLIDPWYCSSDPRKEKWRKWRAFQCESKRRHEEFSHYDTVLFCNPHYAGLTPLFPNAYTVGFDSHADRSRFSRVLPWNSNAYLSDVYSELLDMLAFPCGAMQSPWIEKARDPYLRGRYCILHISASDQTKDYSSQMWGKVYKGLKKRGERVFFTGKEQRKQIEAIRPEEGEILCDKLEWEEFLRVIAHSQLVISVDTVALHAAAAFQRPQIVLYRNASDSATWRPKCGF
jgi:ADP-heptose:LPS heptosyltransferase